MPTLPMVVFLSQNLTGFPYCRSDRDGPGAVSESELKLSQNAAHTADGAVSASELEPLATCPHCSGRRAPFLSPSQNLSKDAHTVTQTAD